MRLRYEEFAIVQKLPIPVFDDGDTDPTTVHVLGWTGDQLTACARVYFRDNAVRIGWITVVKSERGTGCGGKLMAHLVGTARNLATASTKSIDLTALAYVVPFYERFGFKPVGEVGQERQPMSIIL